MFFPRTSVTGISALTLELAMLPIPLPAKAVITLNMVQIDATVLAYKCNYNATPYSHLKIMTRNYLDPASQLYNKKPRITLLDKPLLKNLVNNIGLKGDLWKIFLRALVSIS